MSQLKTWVRAMRLRTLPLAASGILMGSALADLDLNGQGSSRTITILALLTAILLQILSNLANDYGDFVKGTDNENRLGNMRALQSGVITPAAMLRMIVLFVGLCLASGIALLYVAAEGNLNIPFLLFLLLGFAAIAAAIKYTVGKNAYGYSGMGDVFVFIFFGPVSVIGVYVLQHHFEWNWATDRFILLPAIAIGLLSAGVLNTNNIRDIDNDRASGKNTIVVKMGLARARSYHIALISVSFLCLFLFIVFTPLHWIQYLSLLAFYPIVMQAVKVQRMEPSPAFNALLRQLSIGTLLLVVVFVICQTIALGIYVSNMINHYLR